MPTAYRIVIESPIDGLITNIEAVCLLRHIGPLLSAASELGVRPLPEFFSVPRERVVELMNANGISTDGVEIPPSQYFSPTDGLITVRALLMHHAVEVDQVGAELQVCERILNSAEQHGVGWRLEI